MLHSHIPTGLSIGSQTWTHKDEFVVVFSKGIKPETPFQWSRTLPSQLSQTALRPRTQAPLTLSFLFPCKPSHLHWHHAAVLRKSPADTMGSGCLTQTLESLCASTVSHELHTVKRWVELQGKKSIFPGKTREMVDLETVNSHLFFSLPSFTWQTPASIVLSIGYSTHLQVWRPTFVILTRELSSSVSFSNMTVAPPFPHEALLNSSNTANSAPEQIN